MEFEEISIKELPKEARAKKENEAIYQAAKRLVQLGSGRAMRVRLDNASVDAVRKKAHVHYRFRPQKLRTRVVKGYMYMWIEEKIPSRFDVVGVPRPKEKASA